LAHLRTDDCRPPAKARTAPQRMARQWRVAAGLLGVLFGIGSGIATAPAQAQSSFPSKPITLVSPFAAGGTSDALARGLGRELERLLGQSVVVVNRTGAGGTIGIASVASAPADGHTLVMGGLGSVVFPAVLYRGRIKYEPARDIEPVGVVGTAPTLIVVRADLPARTLAELVALAKRPERRLSFASAGIGGTLHLAGVLLEREAGIELNHVPYRGGAPAMTDVAAGNADIALADATLALPFLQSGKVRALAVASAQRSALLPEVPTTAEAGLPQVRMDTWYAVFAPAGLPAPVGERLQAALVQARQQAGFAQLLATQGIQPATASLAAFRSQLKADFEAWVPLLNRVCADKRCE
jgi:tripartite-type tricarboxylate transporter receptor subunit TctC